MKDLTPKKTNSRLVMGLTIAAGLYMFVCFGLALGGFLEWRFALIGFLCLSALLLTWRPWSKENKLHLDSEQQRVAKALAPATLCYIIGYPLLMWAFGKLDSWKDALIYLGVGLIIAVILGVIYILGSKIPKKDD
jgi:ABC-type transport system involved in cytochrome bd biosynthesis fused ATPase/permease subunit